LLRSTYKNLIQSPLRHIPGPLPAKLSPAWLIAVIFTGRSAEIIGALLERYGPVMRVGPNMLSFATAAAARDIYLGVNTNTSANAGGVKEDKDPDASDGVSATATAKGMY
jgi:hypothetical protein